jgi:hypothetical protein
VLNPGLLNRIAGVCRQTFNGHDFFANNSGKIGIAGFDRLTINMDGASPTLGNTATIFCACEADCVAQNPQQWGIWLDVDVDALPIDINRDGHLFLPSHFKGWPAGSPGTIAS